MTMDGLCIPADMLEALIENRLIEKVSGYDLVSFEEELKEKRKLKLNRIGWIDKRLSALDSEIDELTGALVKTKIQKSIDKINKKMAKFEQEMLDLEKEKSDIEADLKTEGDVSIEEEFSKINILEKSPKIRQALLELLIKQIEVELVSTRFIKVSVDWKVPEWGYDIIILDRKNTQSTKWAEEELVILQEIYATENAQKILESLPSHTWGAIYHKAFLLNLKRSKHRGEKLPQKGLSWNDIKFLEEIEETFTVGKWNATCDSSLVNYVHEDTCNRRRDQYR